MLLFVRAQLRHLTGDMLRHHQPPQMECMVNRQPYLMLLNVCA